MNSYRSNAILGLALVGGGLLLLLGNLGILGSVAGLMWSLLFALGGLIFISVFLGNRVHWWALIPGFVLLGLATITSVNALLPGLDGRYTGGLFLAMIGLGFVAVYLVDRSNWWAIMPAGTMVTLGVVAAMPEEAVMPGFFFLGLAATFGLVFILPAPYGRNTWAAIPAVVLLIVGSLVSVGSVSGWNYIWPIILVAVGVYVVFRALTGRR
ncbi:MAG: hypothetical protein ACM3ZA_15600 [Bacillota bacterium]